MSDDIRRRPNGQFQPGQSGNREGARRRRKQALLTPEDCYRLILEVAGQTQAVTNGGKRITLYEANVLNLARGRQERRLASKDFIDLTKGAAHQIDRLDRERADKAARRERGY